MPARKRSQEAKRQQRPPRVVPGWTVQPVGVQVQTEDTWAERTCPTCGSPQCQIPIHFTRD